MPYADPEQQKAYLRAHRVNRIDPDAEAARKAEWYARNKERVRANGRRWRREQKELEALRILRQAQAQTQQQGGSSRS